MTCASSILGFGGHFQWVGFVDASFSSFISDVATTRVLSEVSVMHVLLQTPQ